MKTTMVRTDELQTGMVIAKPLEDPSGRVLLSPGSRLTPTKISRIRTLLGDLVSSIEVQMPGTEKPADAMATLLEASHTLEETMISLQEGQSINYEDVEEAVVSVITERRMEAKLWDLVEMSLAEDRNVYEHGVAVAGIASIIARWRGLADDEVLEVSIAGYLHDIGKVPRTLDGKNPLSSAHLVRSKDHPLRAVERLRPLDVVSPRILLAILQHHERNDGSGFPHGTKGEKIDVYGKVIAVSDEFHRSVIDQQKVGRGFLPALAVRLLDQAPTKLCPIAVRALIESMLPFFRGRDVLLSNHQQAQIIHMTVEAPMQCIVQTADGPLDLSVEKNLHIVSTV